MSEKMMNSNHVERKEDKGTTKQNVGTSSTPELTPELRERIRKNRERALRIQAERKRKLEQDEKEKQTKEKNINDELIQREDSGQQEKRAKKPKFQSEGGVPGRAAEVAEKEEDCEEWEIGMSEWVSKKEAVTKYCLPEGTLAVCEVSTKENPHHKAWASMKLYRRSELRERAYKRHGGKEGLIQERTQREQKRLAKDMKAADNIFQS